MFQGDAMIGEGFVADPGYEIVDLGIAAPCVPVDGLALRLGQHTIPLASMGFCSETTDHRQAGKKAESVASEHGRVRCVKGCVLLCDGDS